MKDRIKQIRKENCKNQTEFAERIGIGTSAVANYELGTRIPMDVVLKNICREFNVNYEWLTTGQGDPYIERPLNQQLLKFFNDTISLEDENIKKRIINGLAQLSEEEWNLISDFIEKLKGI